VAAAAILALAGTAFATGDVVIPRFSALAPGTNLPPGWRVVELPYGKASELSLVRDGATTVLRVRADNSFGSAAYHFSADPARTPMLSWRWKVDRVVEGARMEQRDGEDFAARVYVSFDYPIEKLSFVSRVKLRLARAVYGDVPAAAICYVWDNRHPPGASAWSAHFDHVRIVVVESGARRAGEWIEERRDVDADFRAAFGDRWLRPTPRIVAVVAGNDTDQTHERATAWFGDFRLEERR
jgi:hypothetical protein